MDPLLHAILNICTYLALVLIRASENYENGMSASNWNAGAQWSHAWLQGRVTSPLGEAPWVRPPGLGPGLGCQWEGHWEDWATPPEPSQRGRWQTAGTRRKSLGTFSGRVFSQGRVDGAAGPPHRRETDWEGGGPTKSPGNYASSAFLQRGEDSE